MGVCRQWWMPFRPPLLPADKPSSIKHRGWYKHIDFYINLLNWTKPFDSSLRKWMRKADRHLGSMASLNPRHWRGERLHHHGGGVCWLFVLLWMDLWHHKLIVWKNGTKITVRWGSRRYFLINLCMHHTREKSTPLWVCEAFEVFGELQVLRIKGSDFGVLQTCVHSSHGHDVGEIF